jgi:hypothetical protein
MMHDHWGHHGDHDHGHGQRRSAEASITAGAVFALGFGVAWAVTGIWPFIFPMVFAGVLPVVEGFRRLRLERVERPTRVGASAGEQRRLPSAEKQVLQAAKEEEGCVTPALVALKTELSIDEAEKILEGMTQKGYASMQVNDDGRIEYHFPEFQPRPRPGQEPPA